MRLSASAIGADGTARIGVRLLSGGAALAGLPVTVQTQTGAGWVEVRRLRTDAHGLAVGQLPFTGRTAVRAVFEGTATQAPSTSPTGTVQPRVVAQARVAPSVGARAVQVAGSIGLRAVQLAAAQRGKPYRYGSTGPSSFDCSGFTTYIYNTQLGKRLPRTSAAQAAALPKVAPAAKQPGDLLFFRSGSRVSHVGIYAGGGKMWAAPTSGDRVKLQPIYSSRYSVGRVV
jgi:cell wall-associated NlpC family hydrolase